MQLAEFIRKFIPLSVLSQLESTSNPLPVHYASPISISFMIKMNTETTTGFLPIRTTYGYSARTSTPVSWGKQYTPSRVCQMVLPDVAAQAVAAFPLLAEYFGPHQALPLFLSTTPLTRLYITERCSLSDLTAHIQALRGNNITSFHVEFNKIDNTALNKLFELLPRLTELTIRLIVSSTSRLFKREIYDPRKLPDDVVVDGRFAFCILHKLADAPLGFIPPGLEHLAISWQCYEEFYDQLSAYKLPDFPQLRDALVARCPGLKWLCLNGLYFMFEWRDPMPDGTVREFATKNFSAQYFFASGLMLTFRCGEDLRAGPVQECEEIYRDWDW
ncbi:hypothetical protein B0H14DRAFT_2595929 [Mycena olivaceomarginata]|nr:hypothetical protein B0H14DRAFT_2595929 [Mycena olivaceomarginata]